MLEKIFNNSRPNIPEEYEVIYSHRKTLAIQIKSPWLVIIRAPHYCHNSFIEKFVLSRQSWIEKNLEKTQKKWTKKSFTEKEIFEMKQKLRTYIFPRVKEIWNKNNFLPPYTGIKITKSETRWWSCSAKNSLNFSYRLAEFLNEKTEFIDAVIVHELAHLQEKNHQKPFWDLVYKMMKNYNQIIKSFQ